MPKQIVAVCQAARHPDWSSTQTIDGLGSAAATPSILAQLAHLLHDEHLRDEFSSVLEAADLTIGHLANQGLPLFSKPNHTWVGYHVDVLSA